MDGCVTAAYLVLAGVACIFYAVRAAWITESLPAVERMHQVWFNFAGSVLGWAIGYWILGRFLDSGHTIGGWDVALLGIAALGVVGYLPQTLNAIPNVLVNLAELLKAKIAESLPKRHD